MAKKTNLFAGFDTDEQERAEEQQKIEAAITGQVQKPVKFSKRGPHPIRMSISMSSEDRDEIKRQAAARHMSVADLIHYWIEQEQKQE